MNKLFFILALTAFMPTDVYAKNYIDDGKTFIIAKAVKLGRGNAYSVAADAKINNGGGGGKINTEKLVILTALTVTLRRETANPAPKDTI